MVHVSKSILCRTFFHLSFNQLIHRPSGMCMKNQENKYQCANCFFGNDTVRLVDGGYCSIANLKPGDRVWSLDENGKIFEDEIVLMAHIESNETGKDL